MEPLPQWCVPLPDAEQMRAIDRWAIEDRRVPSLQLMERAGEGVAAAVQRLCPHGPVAVVCGKGNNGGDGLVVARLLRAEHREVTVLMLLDAGEMRGDAAHNLAALQGEPPLAIFRPLHDRDAALDPRRAEHSQQAPELDEHAQQEPQPAEHAQQDTQLAEHAQQDPQPAEHAQQDPQLAEHAQQALASASVIVDGLLGTGFHGAPDAAASRVIEAINDAEAPVLSIDVPSGVNASSGEVKGVAVKAADTVTFHAGKPGLWISPGKAHAGKVQVHDIGVPRGAPLQAATGLLCDRVAASLPRRGASSTKFSSGHVLVLGGSVGLTGAPRMTAEAAMRAGAGYVSVLVPRSIQPILAAGCRPELMVKGLAGQDGGISAHAVEEALAASQRAGALVLGPGLGRGEGAVAAVRELAGAVQLPLVLDADGLNAHAGALASLQRRSASTVLTPHAGELARLLACDPQQIERERLHHVRLAASSAGAIVVLKGDDTLIAHPDGTVLISPGGSPALATAGTGDVLAGVIGALLAQGVEAVKAAAAGVMLHRIAGTVAARAQGCPEGVIASDVIAALPQARAACGAGA